MGIAICKTAYVSEQDYLEAEKFSSDMKVRADKGNKYFYPDVLVSCTQSDKDSHFEVLSSSTRKFDKDLKRKVYQTIPSLEEYVLIEQDHVEVQISQKSEDWRSSYYFIEDDVTFESIGLTLPVLKVYARVENQELQVFLAKQETKSTEIW